MHLTYKQHQVHLHQYGSGPKLMLAFHGFADNGDLFAQVSELFAKDYTVLCLDLPFHGKTLWEGDIYTPEDIFEIVQMLMQQFGTERCSMMCHSMGGRIIWGILPLMVKQIEQLYFFAPAGFQYTFTASRFFCPMWFRRRARNKYEEQEGILRFFEITHRLKLMNRSTYLVFKQQLDLPRRRARLLQTWMAMYYFPMGATKQHLQLLNDHEIPSFFFYGKKDRITPAKSAEKFVQKLKNAELTIFKGNHFFVRDGLAENLRKWMDLKM